ncbi:MAG: PAS domain-containing protein [Chloroflexi bacterium]|nr:PAS domain-containing protein [Chloroflexota bacterium]
MTPVHERPDEGAETHASRGARTVLLPIRWPSHAADLSRAAGPLSPRRRVLGIVTLASLPLIALALYGLWLGKASSEARVSEERIAVARAAALTASGFVEGHLSTARSLAQTRSVRDSTTANAALTDIMPKVLAVNPEWEGWGVFDADGWNIVSSTSASHTQNIGDRPYFQQMLAANQPTVGPALISRVTGVLSIALAVPVDFSDGGQGGLVVFLPIARLNARLQDLRSDTSLRLILIDTEGNAIAHPDPGVAGNLEPMRGDPSVDAVLAGQSGSNIAHDSAGEQVLEAFVPVPGLGWGALVVQPTAVAFDVAVRQSIIGSGVLVLAVAMAGSIAWYLGGWLERAYRQQREATAQAAATTRTLAVVTAESEQRRRFLEGVISSAPIAIAILEGPDYRHETINARYQALRPNTPILGRPLADVFPQSVEQGLLAIVDQVYASGQQYVGSDVPWRIDDDRGTTETRYFTYSIARIDDADGQPSAILSVVLETTQAVLVRQQAEREKDEFLSMASHELKTPLTSLGLAAQLIDRMLRHGTLDHDRLERHVGTIRDQVERAARLIGDLLDVSRFEAGRLDMNWGRVDLGVLSRAAIQCEVDALPEYSRRRIELRTDGQSTRVTADEARLEQVLTNLLSNAVKYSPNDASVDVRIEHEGGDTILEVVDRGIGVPQDERARLFAPFRRTARAVNMGIEGTGLGLYITRRIVESHGGTIEHRETPGGGATFRVRLPTVAHPTEGVPPELPVSEPAPDAR